ncbi:unnamed protein product, partial [Mesorhabditis spiculigera]
MGSDEPCSPFTQPVQQTVCGLPLPFATSLCCLIQICGSITLGIFYRMMLDPTAVVSILFYIHMFCGVMGVAFLALIVSRKKFGTKFEVLLHAFLLSVLLMALCSFFSAMYVPLSFLQQTHTVREGIHYFLVLVACLGFLGFQFFLRNLTEAMHPYMEHHYE